MWRALVVAPLLSMGCTPACGSVLWGGGSAELIFSGGDAQGLVGRFDAPGLDRAALRDVARAMGEGRFDVPTEGAFLQLVYLREDVAASAVHLRSTQVPPSFSPCGYDVAAIQAYAQRQPDGLLLLSVLLVDAGGQELGTVGANATEVFDDEQLESLDGEVSWPLRGLGGLTCIPATGSGEVTLRWAMESAVRAVDSRECPGLGGPILG